MANQMEIEAEAAKPLAWFQHDTDAAQDMKLELVIDEFGMAGTGDGGGYARCLPPRQNTGWRLAASA